ncbi:hypothetical protein GCM10027046_09320 [Uliginosibacterium flavum]|uniref:ExeM/NucH family extracellular endonuclease n=1 Tax=Uliginosibacterium flavum TaxID=1396831 RepID=A0ABV2TIC0_9RHOO
MSLCSRAHCYALFALFGCFCAPQIAQAAYSDLIISEYVEGSSNNKAIELFNGTAVAIDLSAYQIRMYFNGATTASTNITLSGSLAAGSTFVLAHGSAVLGVTPDQINSSSWFNGDDAIVLVKNSVVIDSIGQLGSDPGSEWGTGLLSTADNSLRRKTSVTSGRTDSTAAFDPSLEWEGFATNSFDDLGKYSAAAGGADQAPTVSSTSPANNSSSVATTGALTVTFSEPVNLASGWYALNCSASGIKTATVSGGNTSFVLTPSVFFSAGESCTLTINGAQISDVDQDDSVADTMLADYAVSFTVAGLTSACDAAYTPAYAIQGRGATSPLSGVVTTKGVVVADFEGASPALRGFYLQDLAGDGDPATSDAVFVFSNGADLASQGQIVRVTGTVSEYQGQTQIAASAVESCGLGSVAPTDVYLSAADADYLERFEGMLVRLPQTLYVTEHYQLGRFGQLTLSANERLRQPTNVVAPGAEALALQAQNALASIILDDASNAQNPDPIIFGRGGQPLSASNSLRGGDTVRDLAGVMTYTWSGNAASANAWRVRPVGATQPDFQAVNSRPDQSPNVGGRLRVAGMNVLNFFNSFSGCAGGVGGAAMDCRGAENANEFARQSAKTVAALVEMDADVVGLVEIENDGYGASSAQRYLVDQLNAATAAGTYQLIDVDARSGQLNAMGSDAIKVAFIYKPAKVSPVGSTAVLNSTAFVNAGDSAPRNRPALAQAFEQADGERFIAVINHFKSKGSACDAPDAGDGQANCNAVRVQAANLLRSWLAGNPTGTGDPDVLILGDLNSYAKEDPISAFTGNGWINLIEAFNGEHAYSYVFDGQWGYLDHALASSTLAPQVAGVADWHVNADEPVTLDYNTNFKSVAQQLSLYAADPFRNSDHDPVIVGLDLVPAGTCMHPDTSSTVMLGSYDSGVSNRVMAKRCSIDDLIADETAWSSQTAFLTHVSKVSFDLLKQGQISAAERSKLMSAAQKSGIGKAPLLN